MCEFCKNVDTDDDYNPLVESEIKFGKLCTLDTGVYLAARKKKASLVLGFNIKNCSEEYTHINYCPMCGRKFE